MAWQVCHYFYHGWVRQFWIEPHFLFKYYGFSWVRPWPGNGLYIHVAILGVLALFIAMGFLYRLSTTLFFIGWTYLFLLDEGLWRNHPYLISLFSFLLIFVPANRAFAVDSWLRPSIRTETIPSWTLWILRFQMGVVYFFDGSHSIYRSSLSCFGDALVSQHFASQSFFTSSTPDSFHWKFFPGFQSRPRPCFFRQSGRVASSRCFENRRQCIGWKKSPHLSSGNKISF